MRAEGQAHIERIEAALSLVRQSLDWEQALRRLDELDARVQDPTLWDDPKQAQAITQEQKRLETAINTVREIVPDIPFERFDDAVTYVKDRPGHDWRYAIDPTKMQTELGWQPKYDFETGLKQTVEWYVNNRAWWEPILKTKYAGERLGSTKGQVDA